MKKARSRWRPADRDTMRPEYVFSGGVRGVTAKRYAQGTNAVIIDADLLDVLRLPLLIRLTKRASQSH
jgi:hypothetical protein